LKSESAFHARNEAGFTWVQGGLGNVADDRFHKMLSTDELRAWYGPDHVALAVDRGAVGTLLISDNLFRYVPSFSLVHPSFLIGPTIYGVRHTTHT
jgi:hypothetical protein